MPPRTASPTCFQTGRSRCFRSHTPSFARRRGNSAPMSSPSSVLTIQNLKLNRGLRPTSAEPSGRLSAMAEGFGGLMAIRLARSSLAAPANGGIEETGSTASSARLIALGFGECRVSRAQRDKVDTRRHNERPRATPASRLAATHNRPPLTSQRFQRRSRHPRSKPNTHEAPKSSVNDPPAADPSREQSSPQHEHVKDHAVEHAQRSRRHPGGGALGGAAADLCRSGTAHAATVSWPVTCRP